jgi:sugar O-acyltransferase (sialic acid O-acetyltransferase NeuD family)
MKTSSIKDIAIYGAGGYGREIACLINAVNRVSLTWNIVGFFDDGLPKGQENEYGKIAGGITELNNYPCELSVVMAIANPQTVKLIVNKITNHHIHFPNMIAPDVLFLDQASLSIGQGNIIGFRASVSCNVRIGNFNRFNGRVSLGHDVVIGNYNMFNPTTSIAGETIIGDCNFFGVGSIVLQQKTIGNHTVIAANSVIIKKTKDNKTYIGNPAVELKY